ncbi:MAG: hypothetical protein ACR2GH_15350 [Pseudonocardia sp.]
MEILVVLVLSLGVVGVVVFVRRLACSADDQRLRQRTRDAEREISGISRRTQDAIVAELVRRTDRRRRVVDGEVIAVHDEPSDPRFP